MAVTNKDVESSYARWAPIYDAVFTRVMRPGRNAAAEAVNRHGGKTLNVGVGTGLELPMFGENVQITGIDLSEPMLEIARKRVKDGKLTNVEDLRVMDALNLDFPDASFDQAVAPYVVTTVPDPHRCLDEMARVVRPGGEIVLVNHVATASGPVAWAEGALALFGAKLGWDPKFPWSIIGDWIEARPDIELLERRVLPPLGLFTLVRLKKTEGGEN
ncbi:MAG: class I SAM-dependent methyltransferase [Beijerinckiaceae bacterium]